MNMRKIPSHLKGLYKTGGLSNLIISCLEWSFIKTLRLSPTIYKRVAPSYYRWRSSNDIYQYPCPPDPFKVVYASPQQIRYWTGRKHPYLRRRTLFGRVMDGDWDISNRLFNDGVIHRSMVSHFIDGIPWESTEMFQRVIKQIEQGRNDPRRYQSHKDILNECYKWDQLYKRIKTAGYKSQSELHRKEEDDNRLHLDIVDEVAVDIGRKGELLLADGIHRLSIAKILAIKEIPIVVFVRHSEWMRYRSKFCRHKNIPDHPDLQDLKAGFL